VRQVERDDGVLILCICSGKSSDPYRYAGKRFTTIKGNEIMADWKQQKVNGEHNRREFDRVRLALTWESVP
jgi:hypothetical protein